MTEIRESIEEDFSRIYEECLSNFREMIGTKAKTRRKLEMKKDTKLMMGKKEKIINK